MKMYLVISCIDREIRTQGPFATKEAAHDAMLEDIFSMDDGNRENLDRYKTIREKYKEYMEDDGTATDNETFAICKSTAWADIETQDDSNLICDWSIAEIG